MPSVSRRENDEGGTDSWWERWEQNLYFSRLERGWGGERRIKKAVSGAAAWSFLIQLLRLCSSRDRHEGSADCQALYFIHKFRETGKMTTQGVSGYDRLNVR